MTANTPPAQTCPRALLLVAAHAALRLRDYGVRSGACVLTTPVFKCMRVLLFRSVKKSTDINPSAWNCVTRTIYSFPSQPIITRFSTVDVATQNCLGWFNSTSVDGFGGRANRPFQRSNLLGNCCSYLVKQASFMWA